MLFEAELVLYPGEWKIKPWPSLLFCGLQNHTNYIMFLWCYCWWMNRNSCRFKTFWLNLWTASHETHLCLVEFSSAFVSDVTKSLTTGSINGDSPAVHCATVVINICCIWRAGQSISPFSSLLWSQTHTHTEVKINVFAFTLYTS